jgi:hypothetical protein
MRWSWNKSLAISFLSSTMTMAPQAQGRGDLTYIEPMTMKVALKCLRSLVGKWLVFALLRNAVMKKTMTRMAMMEHGFTGPRIALALYLLRTWSLTQTILSCPSAPEIPQTTLFFITVAGIILFTDLEVEMTTATATTTRIMI